MARKTALDQVLASRRRQSDVSLYGGSKAERYDDAQLARLAKLTTITTLELGDQPFERLPSVLAKLPRLTSLMLFGCPNLKTLEGLGELTGLTSLYLGRNPKLDLRKELAHVAELPDLTTFTISGVAVPPAIATLPSVIAVELHGVTNLAKVLTELARIPTLRKLLIADRKIHLPASIGKLTKLVELEIDARKWTTLHAALGKLVNLEVLKCNGVRTLPRELGKLRALRVLDVSECPIQKLPDEICNLESLAELSIAGNVKKLPARFGELRSLSKLRLPYAMTEPPPVIFEMELDELSAHPDVEARFNGVDPNVIPKTQLDVSIWDADDIPPSFGSPKKLDVRLETDTPLPQLDNLPRVEEVTLCHHDLGDCLARLGRAPKLRELTIHGDQNEVPSQIGKLVRLETLEIALDDLRTIAPAIGSLTRLRSLRLRTYSSTKKLRELPSTIGKLAALEYLGCGSAPNLVLPSSIGKLKKLRALDFGGTKLPAELANCDALADFSWSEQRLTKENLAVLSELRALKRLELSGFGHGIDLGALGTALAETSIQELNMQYCDIKTFGSLAGLRKLKKLILSKQIPAKSIKPHLPGNWLKSERGRVATYEPAKR